MTSRVGQVCRQFGLDPQPQPIRIVENLSLPLEPGTITMISGPSGSGKSAILRAIEDSRPRATACRARDGAGRSVTAGGLHGGAIRRGGEPPPLKASRTCAIASLWRGQIETGLSRLEKSAAESKPLSPALEASRSGS